MTAPESERDPALAPDVREDRYLGGALVVLQREGGYRSSIDALLLVHEALRAVDAGDFPGDGGPTDGNAAGDDAADGEGGSAATSERARDRMHIVDAGAGCGVIALMLATLRPALRLSALEVQPSLLACCREGIRRNGLKERVAAYGADLRDPPALLAADLVVMNPPFFAPGRGRLAPDPERAAARHQLHGDLTQLVAGCARLLHADGTLLLIYPSRQRDEALQALERAGLREIVLRPVETGRAGEARLVLVRARAPGAAARPEATAACATHDTSAGHDAEHDTLRDDSFRRPFAPASVRNEPPLILHEGSADSAGRRPYTAAIRWLIDGTGRASPS